MALPTNADVIVVHGYWLDELTGKGVRTEHGRPATVTFEPVPLTSQTENPNLRDIAAHAHLKTRTRIATIDPDTGYFAVQLVASNDPDLEAYGGRRVTMLGEDPFVIEVPSNALAVTVDAAMAAKTGLAQGSTVRAVVLVDASVVTNPPPTPPVNYLTSAQTLDTVATGVEVHDTDPQAHADLRALLATMPEQARDAIGAALVAGSNVTITPNDGADTITISVSVPSGGAAGTPSLRSLGAGSTQAAAGNDSRLSDPRAWTLYSPDSSPSSGQVPTWNGTTYVPATVTSSGSISDASSSSKGVVQLAGDLSGTAASPRVVNVPRSFTQSATKIANYTAADNEIVVADTTAGAFTITGPTSGASFGLRWRAGTAAPTIAAPTGYTISGSVTVTAGLAPSTSSGELVLWQAFSGDYQPIGGSKPQVALNALNDGRYGRRRVVDVRDFGAVLDGTTDDSAALYNAIMSVSSGGTVQVPGNCTLRLTSAFGGATNTSRGTPRSLLNLVGLTNVTIEGAGASSKITTSVQYTTLIELRGCTNTVIRGLTITGTDTYADTTDSNVSGQLIRLTACNRCTVTQNWLAGAWGIYTTGGTQFSLVTHNQVYSISPGGMNGNGINEDNVAPEVGGSAVVPYANIYSHNVISGINSSAAIVVDNGGARSFTQVVSNTIKGAAGGQGIRVLNPNAVSVIGNLVDSTAREGIYLGMAEFGSSGNRGAVEVSNNTIIGCGNYAFQGTTWPGIRVDSLTSSSVTVEDSVTISNNIVRDSYSHGIEIHGALSNLKVLDNTLYHNSKRGLYLWSDVTANRNNVMVQGNDVNTNLDDGIRIECLSSATLRRIKVDDNSIAYNSKYGLVINQAASNAITDATVNNNMFDNNGTSASTTYSQATLSGRRIVFSNNFVAFDTNAGVAGIVWSAVGTPGTAGVVVDCHQVLNKFNGTGTSASGGGVDGTAGSGVMVLSMRGGDAGFIGYGLGNIGTPNFRLEVNGDIRIQGTRRLYLGGFGASDYASSIYSGGTGIVATDNRLAAAQGVTTIDLGDVTGKTTAQIDALFTVTPGNGTVATGLNSGNPVLLIRRAGKWNVSAAYTVIT